MSSRLTLRLFPLMAASGLGAAIVNDLAERQAAYYRSLSDFPSFGRGWLNRTEARRKAALAMIGDAPPKSV